MSVEKGRRISEDFKEFGLSSLVVHDVTSSISLGSLIITNCEVVRRFNDDRDLGINGDFVLPSEDDRCDKESSVEAVRIYVLFCNILKKYWGENPSFSWLLDVGRGFCKISSYKVNALFTVFRVPQVPNYARFEDNRLTFIQNYANDVARCFVSTSLFIFSISR